MSTNDFSIMLRKYIKTENVRAIFDFIRKLDEHYDHTYKYNGTGSLAYRYESLKSLKACIGESICNCYIGDNLLHQNSLSSSIVFWNRYYPKEQIISASNYPKDMLASICHYYRCVNCISERKKNNIENDDLPYIYEDICLSICEMTHSSACYFIFSEDRSDPNILVQSGFKNKDSSERVCQMMTLFYAGGTVKHGDDTKNGFISFPVIKDVDEVHYSQKAYTILSFSIQKHRSDTQRSFHIVLEKEKESFNESTILCQTSKILFMHERLLNNIHKDYTTLLHYQRDVGYIKPITNTSDHKVNILHISDIHVTQNKQWECSSNMVNNIIRHIRSNSENVDLLAVTGDIVNASSNAIEAQAKYEFAEMLLFRIAKELWGYPTDISWEDRILPNDWKKRIIITSGNHDYAAMNDVIVQTKSRVTKSAEPSTGNSGTMSKFTYLLEFLQRFLDISISGLIDDNLNELRCYRNLKLNVIALNTVASANSLQNNKVGLSKPHIESIQRRLTSEENRNVILAHHAPTYKIDYLEDIYTPYNFFPIPESGTTNIAYEMYGAFKTMVDSLNSHPRYPTKTNVDRLRTCFTKIKERIEDYQRSDALNHSDFREVISIFLNVEPGYEPDKKQIQRWIKSLCESDLYLDIDRFLFFDENRIQNEFSSRLLDKLHSIHQMQDADYTDLIQNYNILCKGHKISVVLAGHVHEEAEELFPADDGQSIKVFIAGKLENNSVKKITIEDDGSAVKS